MAGNKCPYCKINLEDEAYKTIKVRNSEKLALKWIFDETLKLCYPKDLSEGCNLCGASLAEIITIDRI